MAYKDYWLITQASLVAAKLSFAGCVVFCLTLTGTSSSSSINSSSSSSSSAPGEGERSRKLGDAARGLPISRAPHGRSRGRQHHAENTIKNKVFCIIMLKTLLKIMFFEHYILLLIIIMMIKKYKNYIKIWV